jgi:UDP-glucose:(glucosyl)LPS alpha-1,2-glucosyltransferase|tara:strand:- start:847 stop:1797 length:951 start_codon:yes stop_codon:yes gene_type:complete
MKARGGTEIQLEELRKRLPEHYWKKISITTSVPEKHPIDPSRLNILWLKNSYDQPNIRPWFLIKENHFKYDWYVFNSHWSYEKYRMHFNLPTSKCFVIKNALPKFNWQPKKFYEEGQTLKLIHNITPWRGLNVLLGAMHFLEDEDITLDVYSSTQIYGDDFKTANDKYYQPIYDHAKSMKKVNFKGYVPHEEVLQALQDSHVFAYPSIWEETSCNSAIEAMAAGNAALVTNFGALFETCSDYGFYVNYNNVPKQLAVDYSQHVKYLKRILPQEDMKTRLTNQRQHFLHFYNWDERIKEWIAFLNNALMKKGIPHEN